MVEKGLFCPYCGAKVIPGATFCNKCGASLEDEKMDYNGRKKVVYDIPKKVVGPVIDNTVEGGVKVKPLEEIDAIAKRYVSRQLQVNETAVDVQNTELKSIAGQPVYEVSGEAEIGADKNIFGKVTNVYVKDFTLQIHAEDGKVIGKRFSQ